MDADSGNSISAPVQSLLDYWFDVDPADTAALDQRYKRWFLSSPEEDRLLAAKFGSLAADAAGGRLDSCLDDPHGRLGLILALDQLPRNLYRGQAAAFAQDAVALAHCRNGMEAGFDRKLEPLECVFFYMPLQHAESREIQALSVASYKALESEAASAAVATKLRGAREFAELHRDIVERFGRFPHRNTVLGRESTPEEQQYLASDSPSFGQ